MKRHYCTFLLSLPLGFTVLLHGQVQTSDDLIVSPAVASVLATGLKQTKISDCTAAQGFVWQGTTVLDYSSDGLSVNGTDLQGRPWKTVIPAGGVMKCEVWSAKLRPEFGEDLIVLSYGNSGSGYDNELTILFFDKEGRPIPWEATGGFLSTKKGISQLARLDTTGNAGIVVPLREGDRHDGYVYVSHLCSITTDSVTKTVGRRADATWPVMTGNPKALVGNESNNAMSATLSSPERTLANSSGETLTISKQFLDSDGYKVLLSDGVKVAVPHIVVTDEPVNGREIFFAENVLDGVQRVIKDNLAVRILGLSCEEEECRPFTLWASKY